MRGDAGFNAAALEATHLTQHAVAVGRDVSMPRLVEDLVYGRVELVACCGFFFFGTRIKRCKWLFVAGLCALSNSAIMEHTHAGGLALEFGLREERASVFPSESARA